MEESNNKVKTKIIGMIGTAATGVGLFGIMVVKIWRQMLLNVQ